MQYTPESIRAAIGLLPAITSRPTQGTLWALKSHLIDGLRKIARPTHRHEGFAPYLRTTEEQLLVSNEAWVEPADVGEFFRPSQAALTDCQIAVKESEWKAKKNLTAFLAM